MPTGKDLYAILPQLIVSGFGMLVLLMDAIWPKISKKILANLSVLGLLIAGVFGWLALSSRNPAQPAMGNMVVADAFSGFFTLVFVLGAGITILLSLGYLDKEGGNTGEYYALVMFTTVGALVMAASINLICIFIGLEILSIALYILSGYQTEKMESDEAAMKYFLLGAFASAFFLYGIALIYGASGTINLMDLRDRLMDAPSMGGNPSKDFLLLAGVALLLVGFGFKVAVVPFHIWTPDVYEGAPTSVTAFMSVVAKTAGFAAFVRVLGMGFIGGQDFQLRSLQLQISAVLASIAALTMLVGNVVAVVQTNIKRMLAYSSIAHAGYILVGMVALLRPSEDTSSAIRESAIGAILFYSLVYTVSNLGAFGVVLALRKKGKEINEISDLAGIGSRHPGLAVLMALFLLSLAGLPPTAGFFGKLFLIQALVGMSGPLIWLIVLFALTSVVSFYFYLGPIRAMFMDRPDGDAKDLPVASLGGHQRLGLALSAIGTLLFGLWAGGGFTWAQHVAQAFVNPGSMSAFR